MARKKIRLGLIGCGGNMRGAHVPRIQQDGAVELVAVADPQESQARLLMEKWGGDLPWYEDFRQMLRQEELDAVAISSPHALHYEQVRRALDRGLHVLVEKPLTPSARQAKALIERAAAAQRLLVVSYQRNFYPPHVYTRELIQKGALGQVRGVVAYVTQSWGGRGGWRMDPQMSGGGMFMDTGSHLVASVLWMTGLQPVEVSAFLDRRGQPVDIDMVVNLRFANGALGALNTFGSAARHDERIAIHGSEGVVVFHLHQWGVREVLFNGEALQIPSRVREDSPDASFFRWIRNGGKGYEVPHFALQVARLSEAAYRAAATKKPVRLGR